MLKTILYKGIPYIAIGYRSMFTSGTIKINKTWYLFNSIPVMLKSKVFSRKKPFREFVIKEINNHKEMEIRKDFFGENGETLEKGPYYMYSVYATNRNGEFYIGDIDTAYRLIDLSNFRNSNPQKTAGVANVGKHSKTDKWCGWSHRGMCCFWLGDMIFDPNIGNSYTEFKMHGSTVIANEEDMIESASRFARYVS